MQLSSNFKRKLKTHAHHLNPVIITGNKGITERLCLEVTRALHIHELIKIRVNAVKAGDRLAMVEQICQFCQAEFIGMIGHIAILFKENPELKKFAHL
jgi:RNA-binding protein